MNDDPDRSGIRKFLDSLLVRVPELLLAAIGGFGVLIFSIWLSNRDLLDRFADVDKYVEADRARMEQLADCVKRSECEAVRAVLHASELRITALEAKSTAHENAARDFTTDWRGRLLDLERQIQRLATDSNARPDPFTGKDGRALEDRIRELEKQK